MALRARGIGGSLRHPPIPPKKCARVTVGARPSGRSLRASNRARKEQEPWHTCWPSVRPSDSPPPLRPLADPSLIHSHERSSKPDIHPNVLEASSHPVIVQ